MIAAITVVTVSIAVGVVIVYMVVSRKDRTELDQVVIDPNNAPFSIFLEDELKEVFGPSFLEAVEEAIYFINDSVGGELFSKLGTFGAGDIVPLMAYDQTLCEAGYCNEHAYAFTRIADGKAEAIYVDTTSDTFDPVQMAKALAHELGHVLGLSHDDFVESFMYPKLTTRDTSMTSKDRDFLRKSYGLDA